MAEVKTTNANGAWQDVRVSLGPDAEVTGKLSFATPTRIEGKLKGELRATDLLVIGSQAVVQANVQAEKLVVLGEIRGQVQGATRVEICAGGRLYGDIETKSLVVEEGATFEGKSRMGFELGVAAGLGKPEQVV
ncbi:MAG TPA: polymer-forming cytoskeletal protein [Candidatus Binatia bacterium]|nr:polymer-forming cytoskeletal protein [Candidatus Binatia bacterium]